MNKLRKLLIFLVVLFIQPVVSMAQANLPPPDLSGPSSSQEEPSSLQAQPSPGKMPDVTISARLENSKVPLNGTIKLFIELEWNKIPGETAELDFDFPDPPAAEGLVAVGNSFRTTTEIQGLSRRVFRQYAYEYEPGSDVKEGQKITLEKATVTYRRRSAEDGTTLETGELQVEIGPPVRTLKDVAQGNIAKIIIAAALLAAAAALLILLLRERKKGKEKEPVIEESLEEIYMKRLQENETLRIAGRWADYFFGLSGIARGYINDKYGIRTQGQTTDRMVKAVKDKLGEEQASALENFFMLSDRVKFAGHQPGSSEMDEAYDTVKSVIKLGGKNKEQENTDQGG